MLAQAVQQLWPDAKLGIGPPVDDGFYYDFDVAEPFLPEDLDRLETAMRKIIKENQRFERRVTTDAEALDELQDEPYKIELIGLKGSGQSDDAAEGASVEVASDPAASSRSTTTCAATVRSPGPTCAADRTCPGPSGSPRSS